MRRTKIQRARSPGGGVGVGVGWPRRRVWFDVPTVEFVPWTPLLISDDALSNIHPYLRR
jgi:hypothetical protein